MALGISFTHKTKDIKRDLLAYGRLGNADYASGTSLTDEGLGGLRELDKTYSGRLGDPLGPLGRGIFTRARGELQDDFTRMTNSGAARTAQLARQSGGTLTPEQTAALDAENRRNAGESLFRGTGEVANAEAGATLTEQSKLFDRLEGIRKTITGAGQDEKNRGLTTILNALTGRRDLVYGNAAAARAAVSSAASIGLSAAGTQAAGGGGGGAAYPYGGPG